MKISLTELKQIIRKIIRESNEQSNENYDALMKLINHNDYVQIATLLNSLEDSNLTIQILKELYLKALSAVFEENENNLKNIIECKNDITTIPPFESNKQKYDMSELIDNFLGNIDIDEYITNCFDNPDSSDKDMLISDIQKAKINKLELDIKLVEVGEEDPPAPKPSSPQGKENYRKYGKYDVRTRIEKPLILNFMIGAQEHFLTNLINIVEIEDVEGYEETTSRTYIQDKNEFNDNIKKMFVLGFKNFIS